MIILRVLLLRVLWALVTLLVVSFIIFTAIEILPGDIAARVLGRYATEEMKAEFRRMRGLDRPMLVRYGEWLSGVVRGDFGDSLASEFNVAEVVLPKLRNTLLLALYAFILYIPFSIILGSLSAVFREGVLDTILSSLTLIGLSIPEFVMGTLLAFIFGVVLAAFPVVVAINMARSFGEAVHMMTLPAVTLAIAMAVYAIRMLRDNLIEVLESDYVRMAILKGVPMHQVVLRHALPNALVPALNVTALNLAYLIGGVVVVEKVFAFPGIGTQLIDSVFLRDAPVVEACALIVSAVYIIANLFADVITILLNPRLRTAK
ncbi:MAG: ABC transporter permease [Ardenticatenia bacterium]|jgi:peptide/nickel transport system permease protein|nr:MAG: ABC transporter permease [Ardenticatenia bacterium]